MNTRVRIEGMTCQHCVRAVFTALAGVEGISRADVRIGWVSVDHDVPVSLDQIRAAVEMAGYTIGRAETNSRTLPLL